MKRFKHKFKKGLAFILSLAMVTGLIPAMPGGANIVQAATGTDNTPSVSAYATKEQLMDEESEIFAPNINGNATNIGKLVFGHKPDGQGGTTSQEWYILGKDKGVTGDNTIIFAASPLATGQEFVGSNQTYNYEAGTVNGVEAGIKAINSNHYGASALRKALQDMVSNTTYFTEKEKALMNATTVKTFDVKNNLTYTTTDRLYALAVDDGDTTIKAGSSDQIKLAMDSYWKDGGENSNNWFWLRSPYADNDIIALLAALGNRVDNAGVIDVFAVRPASNLNLSSSHLLRQ